MTKGIKYIRNKRNYDVSSTIKEMKVYYSNNNFDNEILLKRLHQLKVDKLYMDSFQGGLVGLLIGAVAVDSEVADSVADSLKEAFSAGIFEGFIMIILFLVFLLLFAGILLGTIKFIKFSYYKVVKSDVINNFLDEKEEEIIKQILNDRLNLELNR